MGERKRGGEMGRIEGKVYDASTGIEPGPYRVTVQGATH